MINTHIAKEGLCLGACPIIAGILILLLGFVILGVALCVIGVFILFFFRQPDRTPVSEDNTVYAPADGRIIQVREEQENGFLKCPVHKISIFMSLLNVHITYAPVNGRIDYIKYKQGNFRRAYKTNEGIEESNENNLIGISAKNGRLAIRQVAGYIARRIVCDKVVGDQLIEGKRIGIIKFGSRIDVYLPPDWQITVRKGESTRGGHTILARWKPHSGTLV